MSIQLILAQSDYVRNSKHVISILEAVTDVIKEKGAAPTAVSYFAVLLTSIMENQKSGDINLVASTLRLFSVLLPMVPLPVIKSKYSQVSQAFGEVLTTFIEISEIVKPVIKIITHLLNSVDTGSSVKIYSMLLNLSIDTRPKIRKVAQQSILDIIKNVDEFHYTEVTIKFILSVMKKCTSKDTLSTLHLLGLLQQILPYLKDETSIVALLKLPTLQQPLLTASAFQCLSVYFSYPNIQESISAHSLFGWIDTLMECTPNLIDENLRIKFSQTLLSAVILSCKIDEGLSHDVLTKSFSFLLSNYRTEKLELSKVTTQYFQELIQKCISQNMIQNTIKNFNADSLDLEDPLLSLIQSLESGLSYPYAKNWNHIFTVTETLFKLLGRNSYPLLSSILETTHQFYISQHDFAFKKELDSCVGSAISSMGSKNFHSIVPLNLDIEDPSGKATTYLLPVLKAHIKHDNLSFFNNYYLPLAKKMKEKPDSQEHFFLYIQIWSLFKSFCIHPTDVSKEFPNIAKELGSTLTSSTWEIQQSICTGIETLINKNKSIIERSEKENNFPCEMETNNNNNNNNNNNTKNNNPLNNIQDLMISPEEAKENLKSLAKFSKNFLPCWFNVAQEAKEENREQVLRTISAYVSISEKPILNSFYKLVVSKLLSATKGNEISQDAHFLSDLAVCFVKYLDTSNLKILWKVIKPQFASTEHSLQKKSYKILFEICKFQKEFTTKEIWQDLSENILTNTGTISSAKQIRLKCISEMLICIENENIETKQKFATNILTEIMTSTKESAARARDSAYLVLKELGLCLGKEENGYKNFFMMMIGGLAFPSPHSISSAVLSISSCFFHFHNELDIDFKVELVSTIFQLFALTEKQIVAAAVSFAKVANQVMPQNEMLKHKEILDDLKLKPGEKTRERKLLKAKRTIDEKNINKNSKTKKEKKLEKKIIQDGNWIVNTTEDPIDFLDRNSVQNVINVDPNLAINKKRKRQNDDFKRTDSGLLYIEDPEEKGIKERKKKKIDNSIINEKIFEEQGDELDSKSFEKKFRKKRKLDDNEDILQEEDDGERIVVQDSASKRRKKNDNKIDYRHTGTDYKSKKSGGDIKKTNKKLEPFAYVPLAAAQLSKKRTTKSKALPYKSIITKNKRKK